MLYVSMFIFGAIVGSFLNVCIYRIPAGESIVSPGSHCPSCQEPILWYQNVPIFSYLLLRGRCAKCKVAISWRYPAIEALTGVLFLLVFSQFGFHASTPVYCVFAAVLVVIAFIDLDHQIIPDVISLPGILLGFFCSALFLPWIGWWNSLLGILVGGGSLFLVAAGYELLTRKEGMGGGDIKLLAMIGAFLGWKAVFPVIFVSSLLGTAVGVPLMLIRREDGKLALPFGPFLTAAALVQLLCGREMLAWYLSLL